MPLCARQPEVIVLGAGVVGLQSAISLLQAGYGVTIVSKFWPGDKTIDYCSLWAGAHWRPHSGPSETKFQQYELVTYSYWTELVKEVPKEECGLTRLLELCFSDSTPPETLWWWGKVPDMRVLSQSELVPGSAHGMTFSSFCIDVPMYLQYLLGKVGELGAKTITAEVDTLEEVFQLPGIDKDVVGMVNCTGLGARKLVPDERMYPAKGQTVLVKGQAKQMCFVQSKDHTAHAIPRIGENLTVLGGTIEKGNWDPEPDPEQTSGILERCKTIAPDLLNSEGEFEVLDVRCGRRPTLDGGPRVDLEHSPGGRFICHNYGHAGAGFQCSYGSATEVVSLINAHLSRT